jgi:PAS domain S-box-containing protein
MLHTTPDRVDFGNQDVEGRQEQLRLAFQNAATGLAIFDLSGKVVVCNPAFAAALGYTSPEISQLDAMALVHAQDREQRNHMMWRMFSGEIPAFVIESRYVRKDHSDLWACDSVSLLRDREDQPQRIIVISEDISKRKRAESLLVQSEGLITMGRLSASIAHELNNPLESVTNLLFLISHGSDRDDMRHYAHLAEEELARVTRIATQTLRFYRPQSAPAPVDLTDVIESVLALFEGRIRRNRVNVIKNFQPATPPLVAYSSELRQVFVNLIGNSLDAMKENGSLRIAVRASRNWTGSNAAGVRVTVCDAGTGIPNAMLQKVFEPFVSTKEQSGTGLGLWITKDIVHRHGGVLHVRSRESGPKQGTCMSVFLPTAIERADANAA